MKYQKKKYSRPLRPWDRRRIESERGTKKEFGLRRKKEIWRAEAIISAWRSRARYLAAHKNSEEERKLIEKVHSFGLIPKDATMDSILALDLEKVLGRRLQSIVFKKGLARTAKHARQIIIHGHVALDGKRIKWPSALVETAEEGKLSLYKKLEPKPKPAKTEAAAPAAPEPEKK